MTVIFFTEKLKLHFQKSTFETAYKSILFVYHQANWRPRRNNNDDLLQFRVVHLKEPGVIKSPRKCGYQRLKYPNIIEVMTVVA